jgi:predicted  nucleic acid-binding Zn-ribbon protein
MHSIRNMNRVRAFLTCAARPSIFAKLNKNQDMRDWQATCFTPLRYFYISQNEVEDMKTIVRRSWRELSEAAAREQDAEKLLRLVEELNRALEEEENQWKKQISPQPKVAHFQSSLACPAVR